MQSLKDTLGVILDEFSPIFPVAMFCIVASTSLRMFMKVLRGDFGCSSYSSTSDVEEPVDMPFNDFEPDKEPEETEEELSTKWTCDYCGSVHKNTDCVCDACGGRRLRW